ncbi:RNA-binding domain-containing protein [Sporosarcina psychrophila]|uniref:RNA-binding domain-containing protein n=1 Tax=Sporosarcina psychrophila TaxID=1476 RepID=UPI0030CB189B
MKKAIELIENNIRENVIYIHPVISNETLAKYISAYSNNNGGHIILGVYDDGLNLYIKNYLANINREVIDRLFNKTPSYKIEDFQYQDKKLVIISTEYSEEVIKYQDVAYIFSENKKVVPIIEKKIFLSYCHNEMKLVDILEQKMLDKFSGKINISRDIKKLDYKDSLNEYMETIKNHDFVISVVSDKYLKSQACMYEITELMRDRDYYRKLLYIIISEQDESEYFNDANSPIKPKVYGAERFLYIKYWQDKLDTLKIIDKEIKSMAYKAELAMEFKEVEVIALNIGEFINKLKDGIGVSFSDLLNNDFEEFSNVLFK